MPKGPSVLRDADQLRREAEQKAEAAERLRKHEAEERDKQNKEAIARFEELFAKAERDAEEFRKKTEKRLKKRILAAPKFTGGAKDQGGGQGQGREGEMGGDREEAG